MPDDNSNNQAELVAGLVKFLLPVAAAFVGWYVSTVVAPLSTRLDALEASTQGFQEIIYTVREKQSGLDRRLVQVEQAVRNIHITHVTHSTDSAVIGRQVADILENMKDMRRELNSMRVTQNNNWSK